MGDKKEKKKSSWRKRLRKKILYFFIFGSFGSGGAYYVNPDLVASLFKSSGKGLSKVIQKVGSQLEEKISNFGKTDHFLTIKGHKLSLEIAKGHAGREKGFMGRKFVPMDHGMLFVFKEEGQRSFWMKNTLIPLSIAYLNAKGEILNILDMEVESPHTSEGNYQNYPSEGPAKYALETNLGWFEKHNIEAGYRIKEIPTLKLGAVE